MNSRQLQVGILGLGDGIVTSLGFMLPTVIHSGTIHKQVMVVGAIGAAASMGINQYISEDGKKAFTDLWVMFIAAFTGSILPALPYFILPKYGAIGSIGLVALVILAIAEVKYRAGNKLAYLKVFVAFTLGISLEVMISKL